MRFLTDKDAESYERRNRPLQLQTDGTFSIIAKGRIPQPRVFVLIRRQSFLIARNVSALKSPMLCIASDV